MANRLKTLSLLTCGAVCSILTTVSARSVSALTIVASTPQSGINQIRTSPTALTTATAPYNYTGNGGYRILSSIDSISVTLTMEDGDTALGNTDYNNLFLGLDGINTGIALNGFANNRTLTQTITTNQVSQATANSLLTALKADGRLSGTVIDSDPNDNDAIRRFAREFTTTLQITGVAVPFEISPGLGSLVLGAWGAIAYFKSKGQKRKFFGSSFSKN